MTKWLSALIMCLISKSKKLIYLFFCLCIFNLLNLYFKASCLYCLETIRSRTICIISITVIITVIAEKYFTIALLLLQNNLLSRVIYILLILVAKTYLTPALLQNNQSSLLVYSAFTFLIADIYTFNTNFVTILIKFIQNVHHLAWSLYTCADQCYGACAVASLWDTPLIISLVLPSFYLLGFKLNFTYTHLYRYASLTLLVFYRRRAWSFVVFFRACYFPKFIIFFYINSGIYIILLPFIDVISIIILHDG